MGCGAKTFKLTLGWKGTKVYDVYRGKLGLQLDTRAIYSRNSTLQRYSRGAKLFLLASLGALPILGVRASRPVPVVAIFRGAGFRVSRNLAPGARFSEGGYPGAG